MVFDDFGQAWSVLLWSTFAVALVMGAVVNKTNFCTMGAVSDWVNMGDTGRFRAWLLAIAVAMIGVVVLESGGLVNVTDSFPPYRSSTFIWFENLFGGILFGIGMTLASGCGQKTLIRVGGGNLKSVVVLAIIAVIAYFMVYPFPGTDKTLMSELFLPWVGDLRVNLPRNQDLGSLIAPENAAMVRGVLGAAIALALLAFIFKSAEFRRSFDNILGGLVVGLAVVAAWYVSGSLFVTNSFDEQTSLSQYVVNWDLNAGMGDMGMGMDDGDASAEAAVKPAEARSLGTQSYTFINPMGQTLRYAANGFQTPFLTFGVMALAGVILGSMLWALMNRNFRLEWFASARDMANHVAGAVLMGFGGVLALGCTIGQGVTGVSTLALGSFLAFAGIIWGSAMTMKVQYYRMLHEDASFGSALVTSLVDMRLLPKGVRKLEAL